MPWAPKKPCCQHGCRRLTSGHFCDVHQEAANAEHRTSSRVYDRLRGSAAKRGYGSRWRAARLAFLKEHPLCECEACGGGALRVAAATVVDHIIPHRGDQGLFWSRRNWRAMAKVCHDRKTARQDGGLGNPVTATAKAIDKPWRCRQT